MVLDTTPYCVPIGRPLFKLQKIDSLKLKIRPPPQLRFLEKVHWTSKHCHQTRDD